ncbi:MAG: pantoate--beta-alanine ligase [Planctomycetes bacterium]|nr:pantoate--beta-alanine ligase [Planctomycetota bacterium]
MIARWVTAYLGFGSNLGNRLEMIRRACDLLERREGLRALRLSALRETRPQGTEEGPALGGPYLNAVAEVSTALEPLALLQLCLEVEAALGRVRAAPNGPRKIDLDLLLYGEAVIELPAREGRPALTVPHPRLLERAFVLEPLAELAPDRIHPLTGRTIRQHWRAFQGKEPGTRSGSVPMKEIHDAREAAGWADRVRSAGLSLGLVPTMGALHPGHHSLIGRARGECDRVAVSIFVNPAQFGPGEDLSRYPRTPAQDLQGCREQGVDLVFWGEAGGEGGVYPEGFQTGVEVEKLSRPLCGEFRPGHFRGVATVVSILFGLFKPHRAYFGQKDFQQARLLQRLARDLATGVRVVIGPTVREADGLAMSSRNRYLSPEERERARAIPRALFEAEEACRLGEDRPSVLEQMVLDRLRREPGLVVQYARALEAATLEPVPGDRISSARDGVVLAVAALAGKTRLIDNVWLR